MDPATRMNAASGWTLGSISGSLRLRNCSEPQFPEVQLARDHVDGYLVHVHYLVCGRVWGFLSLFSLW